MQKISGETFFYQVRKERESKGLFGDMFFHRDITVYSISDYSAEHPQLDNGIETYNLTELFTLTYQKNGQDDTHASEHMKDAFYGERIESTNLPSYSETFLKIAKFLGKMEKQEKALRDQGLSYEHSQDAFLARVFFLKKAALEVEYNEIDRGFRVKQY